MRLAESLILELAEYLRGNRSDPDGYFASFFKRDRGNVHCTVDTIITHHDAVMGKLVRKKIDKTDPWKKRTYNFWGEET